MRFPRPFIGSPNRDIHPERVVPREADRVSVSLAKSMVRPSGISYHTGKMVTFAVQKVCHSDE